MHSNSTDIANKAREIFNTVDDSASKIETDRISIFKETIDREELASEGRRIFTREIVISIEDKTLESEYNKVFICKFKYPASTLNVYRHNKGPWEDALNQLYDKTVQLKEKISEAKSKMQELAEEQSSKMEYSKFCSTSELRDVYRRTVLLNQKSEDISKAVREAALPSDYNPERSIDAIEAAIRVANAALREEGVHGDAEPPGKK